MSTQRRLCDWGGSKTSRDELVHELRRLHHKFGAVTSEIVADEARFIRSQFVDEFGTVVAGLEAGDVVATAEAVDMPEWARRRYYVLDLSELRVVVGGEALEVPDWLADHEDPVVRPTASSRNGMHAPAIDADEPTPRCDLRNRAGGRYTDSERDSVEGFYTECENPGCQVWFDAKNTQNPERGLPCTNTQNQGMEKGGENR